MAIRKINGAKAKHIALLFARLYVIELAVAAAIVVPLSYVLFSMIAESGYREHFNYGYVVRSRCSSMDSSLWIGLCRF